MKPETKKLVAVISIAAIVMATAIVLVYLKKKQQEAEQKKAVKQKEEAEKAKAEQGIVKPIYNRNGELENKIEDFKGKTLYAKADFAKARTTPKVDNGTLWMPSDNNLLAQFKKNAAIGKVVGSVKGKESPAMRWIIVEFPKPISKGMGTQGIVADNYALISGLFSDENKGNLPGNYKFGYVRADVAYFKEYKK
jgi:hypothetical protein